MQLRVCTRPLPRPFLYSTSSADLPKLRKCRTHFGSLSSISHAPTIVLLCMPPSALLQGISTAVLSPFRPAALPAALTLSSALRTPAGLDGASSAVNQSGVAAVAAADLDEGCMTLHEAAAGGSESHVQLLIARGAAVDLLDSEGRTALSLAAENGHGNVVQLLLGKGAGVAVTGPESSMLPLHFAAKHGHHQVVRQLLEGGADVHAVYAMRCTALYLAVCYGHLEVVKALIEKGADVNVLLGYRGRTALHIACAEGHDAVVEWLLDSPAEASIV